MIGPNTTSGYSQDALDAQVALQADGFQAAIWVKSGEVFDPVQGKVTKPAVWGVIDCYAVYGGGATGLYPGVSVTTDQKTLSRKVKKEMYIDAVSLGTVIPQPDDLFQDELGFLLEITRVDCINPGGVAVLWKLQVSK